MDTLKQLFHVSASPHIRSGASTGDIMRDVVIALLPASLFSIYWFGFQSLLLQLVCVTACVLSEYIWRRWVKKAYAPYECSAIVTGLLLAMNLPVGVPVWMAIAGSVFAIIVVKELYGGLGQNFMNPALAGRCFLLICFAGRMTNFSVTSFAASGTSSASKGLYTFLNGAASVDGISGATPLAVVKGLEAGASVAENVSLFDMFFGFTGGVLGETSAFMILLGAAYMVIRKVISLRIPLTYIGSFAIFVLIFGGHGFDMNYLAAQLLGGGLMLGAFFMATDYVTSPITKAGQIVFGVLLGILTGLFRVFGNSAEGVSYAIIFGNLLTPLIEKYTMPRAFGKKGK